MLRLAAHKKVNEQQQEEAAEGVGTAAEADPAKRCQQQPLVELLLKSFCLSFGVSFSSTSCPAPLVLFWRRQALLVQ